MKIIRPYPLQLFLTSGVLSLPGGLVGTGYMRTPFQHLNNSAPDVQVYIMAISKLLVTSVYAMVGNHNDTEAPHIFPPNSETSEGGFIACVVLANPRSRGTFRLQSDEPSADPLIDPEYLKHPDDLKTLVAGKYRHLMLF